MDLWTFFSNITSSIELIRDTGYYFFFTGTTIGATFVDTIVLTDRYLGIINLQNIPQWKRFKGVPQAPLGEFAFDPSNYEDLPLVPREDTAEETLPVTEDVTEGIIF